MNRVRYLHGKDDPDLDEVVEKWRRGEVSGLALIALNADPEKDDDLVSLLEDPPDRLERMLGFIEILRGQVMELLYPEE